MLFLDYLRPTLLRKFCMVKSRALVWGVLGVLVLHFPLEVRAQDKAAAPSDVVVVSTPRWNELSIAQQESLMPLHDTWNTLDYTRKRKWLALVRSYPSLAPPEQSKLHSRMAEWAALNPTDRELARFNFVETKKLAAPDRASTWEAYKALSPEERQSLAARATAKPTGAATAIKSSSPQKLTPVPVTRHTPVRERDLALSKQSIDPNTLLPLAVSPVIDPPAPQN